MAMTSLTSLPLVVAALVAASACSPGGSDAGPPVVKDTRPVPLDTLLTRIRSGPPQLRQRAAFDLSTPGPRAEERMRALRRALGDPAPQVSSASAWSLGEIGAPAIPVLTDALRNPDPGVRRLAAYAMGRVGLAARDAVKEALTDPDKSVRNMAALAIARMGPRASRGAGAADLGSDRDLAQGLKSPDPAIRLSVLLRYQAYVGDTAKSLPLLTRALGDADPVVRRAAANALIILGPSARDALSAALSDSNPTIRREAAIALVRLSRGTP